MRAYAPLGDYNPGITWVSRSSGLLPHLHVMWQLQIAQRGTRRES